MRIKLVIERDITRSHSDFPTREGCIRICCWVRGPEPPPGSPMAARTWGAIDTIYPNEWDRLLGRRSHASYFWFRVRTLLAAVEVEFRNGWPPQ